VRTRLLLLGLVLAPATSAAQAPEEATDSVRRPAALALLAQRRGSATVLRWAPGRPDLWLHGNRAGYVVERAPLPPGEAAPSDTARFERLTPAPLVPWTPERWRAFGRTENRYLAVAAQMLDPRDPVQAGRGELRELRDRALLLENRHGFALFAADMDSTAADALALRWADSRADAGTGYVYRVFPAAAAPGARADTAYAFAPAGEVADAPPPEGFRTIPGDGQVGLAWELGQPGAAYTGFHVDRSDDGGRTFRRLTPVPLVVLNRPREEPDAPRFVDSATVNGRTYRYRVSGITPFAALSAAAEADALPRDLTPPPAALLQEVQAQPGEGFQLRWQHPGGAADLAGFRIGVAADPDGPFEVDMARLLPPATRAAEDTRAIPGGTNYFVVIAVDTAGNAAPSQAVHGFRADSVPPAPPAGLSARADSTGRVTLTWAAGPEPDLAAYRVFRKRQDDHLPVLQTGEPLADTMFVDTLEARTLTREAFYEVVALDHNFNASAPTRVRVTLPDVVPPAAPVISGVTPAPGSVALAWVPSSSADVLRHRVLRRESGAREWAELAVLAGRAESYADTAVLRGRAYEYTVQAEDSAGLRSPHAAPVAARPYDNGVRPGVDGLRAAAQRGTVRLSWALPAGESWVVVYRGTGDEAPAVHRTLGSVAEWEETVPPGAFSYAVQLFYRDGGRSVVSPPVRVVVPAR
jgi:hypothetical protein